MKDFTRQNSSPPIVIIPKRFKGAAGITGWPPAFVETFWGVFGVIAGVTGQI